MSVSTVTPVGRFYKQIDDLKNKIVTILVSLKSHNICDTAGQLIDIDQEIIKINKYYDKLLIAKQANVRMPIELLYNYGVKRYATQILQRDEQYFLGEVDTGILSDGDTKKDMNQSDLLFISQIRLIWNHIGHEPNVKKNLWDYIQIICILAEKVTNGNVLEIEKARLISQGLL